MKIDLSILEFGNINPPKTHAHDVLNGIFEYAQHLDQNGFKRYWLSEHYSPEFAWFSPETLLPLLAGYTEKIKIGQAGVLLNYHSPFRVIHNFQILNAMFSGRIDLGMVPAYITNEAKNALLGDNRVVNRETFNKKVAELFALLNGAPLKSDNEIKITLPLRGVAKPSTWFLGISESAIPTAVKYKSGYSLSLFHVGATNTAQVDILKKFKDTFYEKHNELPEVSIATQCICSENRTYIDNYRKNLPSDTQPFAYVIGNPEECKVKLEQIAATYGASEIVIKIPEASYDVKYETTTLLANKMLKKTTSELYDFV
jgi:luciferase family oxidoreductase group 1